MTVKTATLDNLLHDRAYTKENYYYCYRFCWAVRNFLSVVTVELGFVNKAVVAVTVEWRFKMGGCGSSCVVGIVGETSVRGRGIS